MREKIAKAIFELVENPTQAGYKKLYDTNYHRIRIGVYRVIYEIFDDKLVVYIVSIGHRKDIYF